MAHKFTKDMKGRDLKKSGGRSLAQMILDKTTEREEKLRRQEALGVGKDEGTPISRMGKGLEALRKLAEKK